MAQMTYIGNIRTQPAWMADLSGRDHLVPFPAKIDPSTFTDANAIPVQVTAAAAAAATSITISALTFSQLASTILIAQGDVLIPKGSILWFGGGKFAQLTADAVYGATTLSVVALDVALAGTETAVFTNYLNVLTIPSGIAVSRTWAQRAANAPFHPAISTDNEIYIIAFDVPNAKVNNDIELYRPISVVKENYLPGYTTSLNPGGVASALLTALRGIYTTILGVD